MTEDDIVLYHNLLHVLSVYPMLVDDHAGFLTRLGTSGFSPTQLEKLKALLEDIHAAY